VFSIIINFISSSKGSCISKSPRFLSNSLVRIDEKNKCEEVLSKIINQPWVNALAMISKNGFSYGYESSEGWFVGGGDGSLIT